MSWGWYEIGRTDGYVAGKLEVERPRVVIDHSSVYEAQKELDRALAHIAAYRMVIAAHPDRATIERNVQAIAPCRYVLRRITGVVGTVIKLTGWIIALSLIGSTIFR